MNKVDQGELYAHLSQFLKAKGIELQEGAYTRTIQKGCQFLADTINLSQQAVERATSEIGKNLDRARQVIHEKTAPRTPPVQPHSPPPTAGPPPAGKSPKTPPRRRPAANPPRPRQK